MSGDTTNASFWTDADVYIGDYETAVDPATVEDDFGAGWELVGLLDGDDGFTYARSEDKTDHYAWGGIIVRTSRRNFKQTVTFTALEDNDVTRDLIWPGSTVDQLVVPRAVPVKLAIETREGDKIRRMITADYAEIEVNGDINENESDLTKYQLIATVFPDASESPAVLFNRQYTADGS